MSNRNASLPLLLFFAGLAVSDVGCGGGSSQSPPPPISVAVSPSSATLQAGGQQKFTAIVANDSSNMGVSWTVTCASGPCGTVSPVRTQSGSPTTYTAPSTPPASDLSVTLLATSVADMVTSQSATVTVSGLTIAINPQTVTVAAGTTTNISATVANDPSKGGVTWTVSCVSAPCGTVSPSSTASGVPTTYSAPPLPIGDLSVSVTAAAVANNTVTNSAAVTVPGLAVSMNPSSATVIAGATAPFTATVANDPKNLGVAWSLSCQSPPCGTFSPATTASGVPTTYSAPPTPPETDLPVTLTANSVFNNAASGSAVITVPAITVSVSPNSALIPVSLSQTFTGTVANDPANKGVSWTLTQGASSCSPACGAISPPSTTSGAAATYTAPTSIPSNSSVSVTAVSTSDSTKTDVATVTLSTGSVKLVPANLKFGNFAIGASSPPQSTTLTNTGNSNLSIKGITITGTDAADFIVSPTNPCGTTVASGATCNISVVFKPKTAGSRTATLSITDTSTDSPQQVSLSGTGRAICRAQIKQTLSGTPVRTALTTFGTATTPQPTGPTVVGTRLMHIVDSTREDPFLENRSRRELMVRFWYPASLDQSCRPAEYAPAAVWSYFSQLMKLPLPAVSTNSCLDAPVADGPHPVVVFSHGYTGTFTDYTFLFEDLASRGYVVASVDHTYEATAVQFPDGRFVHSGFGSHLGDKLLEDDEDLAFALSVRLDDLKFLAFELDQLSRSAHSPFAGKLDTGRMAVAGHSMGGLAASLAVDEEARFKVGLIIDVHDGYVPDGVVGTTQAPVFILASGREQWTENECKLWNNLHGPRFAVNLEGSEHLTPSDAVWLAKGAVKTGTMGPDKTIAAIRQYIAAFLDSNLRGFPMDPLLTGPSPIYPDVLVVPPSQPLCSKDMLSRPRH